jgi:hypothetical protein
MIILGRTDGFASQTQARKKAIVAVVPFDEIIHAIGTPKTEL